MRALLALIIHCGPYKIRVTGIVPCIHCDPDYLHINTAFRNRMSQRAELIRLYIFYSFRRNKTIRKYKI